MKKMIRSVSSLVLALLLICSLALPTFATEVKGDVEVSENKVTINPMTTEWTDTDLFGSFKDLMPGDTREEIITLKNLALQYDYVVVYMEAQIHPEQDLVAGEQDLEQMHDFLSKLDMTVTCKGNEIYHDSPDQAGDLSEPVKLGTITKGGTMELEVELYWDPNGDYDYNLYANRVGEVDWVFTFEGHYLPNDNPKTGDFFITGAITLMILSAAAILVLIAYKRRADRR